MAQIRRLLITSWILRGVSALVLLQTLFFKFSGARESVYIFSALGVEPWGRIATGVFELVAAILILVPRTVAIGAILSMGLMAGAILSQLTRLGVTLPAVDDHGELFALAVLVFLCSAAVLILHRAETPILGPLLATRE